MSPFVDTRVQLHWAAQVVSSHGDFNLPARPDDSQSNMEWKDGKLVGQTGLALRVADLALEHDGSVFPLAGRTLREALDWAGVPATRDYDMPAHPVQGGATFAANPDALAELSRWYATADTILRDVAGRERKALPVRCWPHHFDIASISYLGRGDAQLGFGLSPGDHYYAEPYWYLTAYPLPPEPNFPPFPDVGAWHKEGFTGAVLVGVRDEAQVRAFFTAAFHAGRTMLN